MKPGVLAHEDGGDADRNASATLVYSPLDDGVECSCAFFERLKPLDTVKIENMTFITAFGDTIKEAVAEAIYAAKGNWLLIDTIRAAESAAGKEEETDVPA